MKQSIKYKHTSCISSKLKTFALQRPMGTYYKLIVKTKQTNKSTDNPNKPIKNEQRTWTEISTKSHSSGQQASKTHLMSLIIKNCKSKLQWDNTSKLLGCLLPKIFKKVSVGEAVEKRELLNLIGGNVKWHSSYGKPMEVPQKLKNRSTIWPSNLFCTYISKNLKWKS